tara:strand:- start:10654 stop:12780 length:2127 start_codon:yes stop_codon:yes gene_type:complete
MDFKNQNEELISKTEDGFAIPQILIIGIGIAVGVSSLMAASILGLTGSKINRQELLAKSSSYSGITKLRALLNDNTKGRLLNYFWIVNNCSQKSKDCDSTTVPMPMNKYWADDSWCNGEVNCNGRQKAPYCSSENNISWFNEQQIIRNLFEESNSIGNTLVNADKEFSQAFNLISSKYIGTEDNGINSILIEGLSLPKNSENKSASNKLRINIQVTSNTSESGFGFISAGENNSDKKDSLFLGNLTIFPLNTAKGSIIWRMNINDENDCGNFQNLAKGENASLPQNGNGGIWAQPLGLPRQPRLKNVIDLGNLICTAQKIQESNSSCKLDAGDYPQKTFRIYSLYARGPGSKFEVSTSDTKKIILEIMGDIDISNEGQFCHRNGTEDCGTGKPENLTILFKQKNTPEENILSCNLNNYEGGVTIKNNNDYLNINYPINNNLLPGNSFLIDNTGINDQKFGAFTYGPKTTFISSKTKSDWVQITNNQVSNSGLIVTSRGSYGYIQNTLGSSVEDNLTNLILDPQFKLIPYAGSNVNSNLSQIEIIGVGRKINNLPLNSEFNSTAEEVFLIFDTDTSNYHLRTFTVQNINRFNQLSLQNTYPGKFAILNQKNSFNDINLGNDLNNLNLASPWLDAFGIQIKKLDDNYVRNFSGAVWVKNLCLDNQGEKTWEFSKNFIDKLISWHGNEFNWGVKYYRGKSIILWDTLRDFN